MFKTHLAIGTLACILILRHFKPELPILFGAVFLFASVFPDIDIGKGRVGNALWPLSRIINLLFGHRGFMHTIFPPAIGFLALAAIGFMPLGVAFLAGYMVHLAADMVTVQGIMPFFPLSKIRASGPLKTGGMTEFLVLSLAVLGLIYSFITTM